MGFEQNPILPSLGKSMTQHISHFIEPLPPPSPDKTDSSLFLLLGNKSMGLASTFHITEGDLQWKNIYNLHLFTDVKARAHKSFMRNNYKNKKRTKIANFL